MIFNVPKLPRGRYGTALGDASGKSRHSDKHALVHTGVEAAGPTVVVLTALGLEYQAVREHLRQPRVLIHPRDTMFEVGDLAAGAGRIAIAETGTGNLSATVITDRAIDMFRPKAVLIVGVAGALFDCLQIGDVVVATKVYGYHGGTDSGDGFLARPQSWPAPYGLSQIARHVARTGSWTREPTDPAVHFLPVAAGEIVLNSRNGSVAEQLHRTYHDAAAIEMESAGAAYAAHINGTPVLTVRGISDLADGDKYARDRDGRQLVAARHAAAFAVAVVAALTRRRRPPFSRPA